MSSTRSLHGWSNPQQIFLYFLLCLLLIYMTASLQRFSVNVNQASANSPPTLAELKIDPNTADFGSLIRIPDLGPGRAKRLLAYRNAHQMQSAGQPVFTSPQDLQNIPDFGPKIAATLTPYMTFPTSTSK